MSALHFPKSKIYIAPSSIGRGVFASRPFRTGEPVFTLTGPLLTLEEVLAKGSRSAHAFQMDHHLYLYPKTMGGRFINHSCDPNAGLREDREMVALRDIQVGEEVCFDYSTCVSEKLWSMPCRCGSSLCRGIIGDFHDLPPAIQRKYLALGVVQRFIVRQIFERASALASRPDFPSKMLSNLASEVLPLSIAFDGRMPSVA